MTVLITVLSSAGCGGTTGREDAPPRPAVSDASVGTDATLPAPSPTDLDAALFDVIITYTDRQLPDVAAPIDAGDDEAEASFDYSTCPTDLPADQFGNAVDGAICTPDMTEGDCVTAYSHPQVVEADGAIIPAFLPPLVVPADRDPAGHVVPAPIYIDPNGFPIPLPEAGACGGHAWLGSHATDGCYRFNLNGLLLPPCLLFLDAGTATGGTAIGQSRYDLCTDALSCAIRTGCYSGGGADCLFGTDLHALQAVGPCRDTFLAAFELTDSQDDLVHASKYASSCTPPWTTPGVAAGCIGAILEAIQNNNCPFGPDAGH